MTGIVAIGDSITNACSADLALGGVPARSWVQVVADVLQMPLDVHARPGASSAEIRRDLLPNVTDGHALGLVYVGVNNITSWRSWRRENLADDLAAIVRRMGEASDRVLVMGYPPNLGHSRAVWPYGPSLKSRIGAAAAVVEKVATGHGAGVRAWTAALLRRRSVDRRRSPHESRAPRHGAGCAGGAWSRRVATGAEPAHGHFPLLAAT